MITTLPMGINYALCADISKLGLLGQVYLVIDLATRANLL
jgi:hypothetical protein